MLYLGNGMRELKVGDGRRLCVFPDFSDPGQFYYLPDDPAVASLEDGSPAIRMIVYREDLDTIGADDPEAVAFLSLDVDLAWDPELIEEARGKLRVEDQLAERPRLTPIFYTKGSVKLMLLDAVTPEPDAASPGTMKPTEFVTQIVGAGSPSLYGDNRAIFQATLSKKAAAVIEASLDGMMPIGVVYSLTFPGLQPAYNIRAKVDWERVQKHFSEQRKIETLFFEHEIEKSIDSLIENKVIDIEVTVEGIGGDAMDADREAAMTSIRQLIFDKFFEATFQRIDPAGGSTADNIVDGLASIAKNGFTLGCGYSYKRKEVTIEELRSLDIDWTARRAAERTIYPQAHISTLIGERGVTRETLIKIVDGADAAWKVQPFEVLAAAAWEADAIAGITVDVEYEDADNGGTHATSLFLDKDHPKATKRDWLDRTSGGRFRYRYEVVFTDGSVKGPRPTVSSGWLDHEGSVLVVNPQELYEALDMEIGVTADFPFNRWPAVHAMLRYVADDGSFEFHDDQVLTAKLPAYKARVRIDRGVPGRKELRLGYIGATGERVELPWMPMDFEQWVVEDPHPNKLTVRAVVAGDRQNIANLLVDFEYTDVANGIHESGAIAFATDTLNQALSWTTNLADPTKRRYRYRMTLVTKSGDFLETGWISSDAPSLPVGELYVRLLNVELATGTLGPGVEAVEARIAYHDDANDVHDEKLFRLGANASAAWKLPLKDAGRRSYDLTVTWRQEDGFDPHIGPSTTSETYLVLPGTPPR